MNHDPILKWTYRSFWKRKAIPYKTESSKILRLAVFREKVKLTHFLHRARKSHVDKPVLRVGIIWAQKSQIFCSESSPSILAKYVNVLVVEMPQVFIIFYTKVLWRVNLFQFQFSPIKSQKEGLWNEYDAWKCWWVHLWYHCDVRMKISSIKWSYLLL